MQAPVIGSLMAGGPVIFPSLINFLVLLLKELHLLYALRLLWDLVVHRVSSLLRGRLL